MALTLERSRAEAKRREEGKIHIQLSWSQERKRRKNQAKKSTGWMPRRQPPKKDAASCEKPRGAASKLRSVDIRMGEPVQGNAWTPANESIVCKEGTRGTETSKYPEEEKTKRDFLSSGERTGKRPNQRACFLGLRTDISYLSL